MFIRTHSLPGAGIDRLPLLVCPQKPVYHTLQKLSNLPQRRAAFAHMMQNLFTKALDKQSIPAYTGV